MKGSYSLGSGVSSSGKRRSLSDPHHKGVRGKTITPPEGPRERVETGSREEEKKNSSSPGEGKGKIKGGIFDPSSDTDRLGGRLLGGRIVEKKIHFDAERGSEIRLPEE